MPSAPSTPDVIIVGGGVIGCATAYFLGKDHHLRSLILERDAIGSQASGSSAGELGPLGRSTSPPESFVRFGLEGLRLHRELGAALVEESGINYHLSPIPTLRVALTEQEAVERQAQTQWLQKHGMRATWLDAAALRSMDTWLTDAALGASYSQDELQLESYQYALAVAQAAERHGATIRHGEVTGLQRDGERVTGVVMASDSVASGAVVVANGPWSQHAGEWMGFPVPVVPLRGQIVHLAVDGPPPEAALIHSSGYLLPKPSGRVYAGTTEELAGFVRQATPEGQESIMQAVLRLAPAIIDTRVIEVSSCLRPLSLDELPIIGPVPAWSGLFLATGHGRKGILMSLVTGKHLAQQIATGRTDPLLTPFSPERLAPREAA
jgi:glycine oxidase